MKFPPSSFDYIEREFFTPMTLCISDIVHQREGDEYGAVRFQLNGTTALFRHAKHTPTKIGQFVTLYKRETSRSEIAPIDQIDGIRCVFVLADDDPRFGMFVLGSSLLAKMDIFSVGSRGGKRAFRVYGPWTEPTANQAVKTKAWQCAQFAELTDRETGMHQLKAAMNRAGFVC